MNEDPPLVALTQAQFEALIRATGQPTAVPPQSRRPGLIDVFGYVIAGALVVVFGITLYVRFLAPVLEGSAPISAVEPTSRLLATAVVPTPQQQPVYVPVAAPQATNAPAVIAETAIPAEPTAPPLPTADVANISALDDLANAVDLASGGNPAAATPVPLGAELPTVVVGPVDPSGGDAGLMARACVNSGAGAACSAPVVSAEQQAACALDLAYGGAGCTPVAGINVHVGGDSVSVRVGR